ncbi:ATPase [Spirochaetia bacterium]|nr:ATPase [Spirochaetia bacterium]
MSFFDYADLVKRNAMQSLIRWKNKPDRMPLIIEGARQIGKTWLMKELGRLEYKQTLYINFDINNRVKEIFQKDISPRHIIEELELTAGFKIVPEDTLIIFDEIQECNRALVSLKYFCEESPEYHIVSAGSLLGVAIHRDNSFPVGKVETLRLYPMSFAEFLDAVGETRYRMALERGDFNNFYVLETDLTRLLKMYYFVGGMPRAVLAYIEGQDLNEVRRIQEDIIGNFEKDFSKHINAPSIPKLGMIWNSIPAQLAKEKKQFIYRDMKPGARASAFEDALYWLEKVGLVYRVNRISVPSLPLAGFQDEAFKLYMADLGLLSAMTGLTVQNLADPDPEVFNRFRGALTEQYVLQELKAIDTQAAAGTPQVFYWVNDRKKGIAEVDFVIQYNGEIIPIEAKASINLKAKSLKTYMDYYRPLAAIRTSLARYNQSETLYDIPLYLIGQFWRVVP